MSKLQAMGYFNGAGVFDSLQASKIFATHPSQAAAKEVVSFSQPAKKDALFVEADRRLAAGENLLASRERAWPKRG